MTGQEGDFSEELFDSSIVDRIENLPPLLEGYMRGVHFTREDAAKEIAQHGLNYERHGILSSTARWWSDPNQVEYRTDDPRFSYPGVKVVVFDMPAEEFRKHDRITSSPPPPGVVPAGYIVGVVDPV